MELLEFLATYNIWTVILIGFCSIFCLIKIIEYCKKLWKKRQDFAQQNLKNGIQEEREREAHELKEEHERQRVVALEMQVAQLSTLIAAQQDQINLLIRSDELDIKAWIKNQHEKWIALQCIDSQSLDLLLQRYEVYAREGGNSWAEKLVNEIKALPVVTVIPVQT